MNASLTSSALLAAAVAVAAVPTAAAERSNAPGFRDLVIENHFNNARASDRTVGLEVEVGGLSLARTIEVLTGSLGGRWLKDDRLADGRHELHRIVGTDVGDLQIQVQQTSWGATVFEIVTEPIRYRQVVTFARALDDLGLAGAHGSRRVTRQLDKRSPRGSATRTVMVGRYALHVNMGIDATDGVFLKNLLANYYRNQAAIRRELRPAEGRRPYIQGITREFLDKLSDPAWQPTPRELYRWYRKHSPTRRARLNAMYALLMDPANREAAEADPSLKAKERQVRPAVEFREANTVLSTAEDPTLASRTVLREVKFALSLAEASTESGNIDFNTERRLRTRRAGRRTGRLGARLPSMGRSPSARRSAIRPRSARRRR